jgi:hypothetical protein
MLLASGTHLSDQVVSLLTLDKVHQLNKKAQAVAADLAAHIPAEPVIKQALWTAGAAGAAPLR